MKITGMSIIQNHETLDAVADPGDVVVVEVQNGTLAGTKVLYIHVNGITMARIGRIHDLDIVRNDRS